MRTTQVPKGRGHKMWSPWPTRRELIAERERKVAELRALGRTPTPTASPPAHRGRDLRFAGVTPPARTRQGAPTPPSSFRRSLLGGRPHRRLSWFRWATFVKLRDRTGEIQVCVKMDVVGEAVFEAWRRWNAATSSAPTARRLTQDGRADDPGRASGPVTKAMRPLPEKCARPPGRRAALPAALRRSRS